MKTINPNREIKVDNWMHQAILNFNDPQHFTKGLDDLIALCEHKTLEHISRVMKQQINKTPCEYMNELRLNYAAEMILTTNLKIIDISMEAGYNSLSYFNRIFKNKFGISPTQYRKR